MPIKHAARRQFFERDPADPSGNHLDESFLKYAGRYDPATGETVGGLTAIFLPTEVVRAWLAFCEEQDVDSGTLVADLMRHHLAAAGVTAPADPSKGQ